jgi:hypothetical protein
MEPRGKGGGPVVIEVLAFAGCPHRAATVALAEEVAAALGVAAEIQEVEVRDTAEAERLCFLGSPTLRVNGADVEPGTAARTDYALGCRLYAGSGVPSRELLSAALRSPSGGGS